jgi:hypothetical protein
MAFGRLGWDGLLSMGIVETTILKESFSSAGTFDTLVDMLQVRNNDRLQVCHD